MLKQLPRMPRPERLALQTPRLDLLLINRDHAARMFKVLADPALYEFTGGAPSTDVAALARRYESWEACRSPDGSELWFNWVLRLRSSGDLIGHVQAGVALDHADVAWVVGTGWQRHGYATEAAQAMVEWLLELGVLEIRASINPAHAASIRVVERAGLVRTNEVSGSELIWKLARTS